LETCKHMKKIYISGKITGIEETAPQLFKDAEDFLKAKGSEVVNPMTINHDHDKSWLNYMKTDIVALMECDSIFMLENWEESKGACIEHSLAIKLGYDIMS